MKEAVSIAVYAGNNVLLGRRRDTGKLTCPGGHLEPGELPAAGAARECREEIGFEPHDLEPLASFTIGRPDGSSVLVHAFRGRAPKDSVPTNAGDPDREFSELLYADASGKLDADLRAQLHHTPDVCLQFLGLVPPQTDTEVLERGEAYVDIEDLQKMALTDLQAGVRMPSGAYDYSHLLPPAYQGTHQLVVQESPMHRRGYVHSRATLVDRAAGPYRPSVGAVEGAHQTIPGPDGTRRAEMYSTSLRRPLRGQGLGKALYEAWLKHAHSQGQTHVKGDSHSTAAHNVHAALAAKHGMSYHAERTGAQRRSGEEEDRPQDNNEAFDNYQYALKSELRKAEVDPRKASPDTISWALRNDPLGSGQDFLNRTTIGELTAAQLKPVTDYLQKRPEYYEEIAAAVRNPHIDAAALQHFAKSPAPEVQRAVLTEPHVPEAVARDTWAHMRPYDQFKTLEAPGVKPDMMEAVFNNEAIAHQLSPSVLATALQNPSVKPADLNKWFQTSKPFQEVVAHGAAHIYGLAKPELRDTIWKHMGPTIGDKLLNASKPVVGRWGDMDEAHARQLAAEGLVPDVERHQDLVARFHELGLPTKAQDAIEVRPGTDRLRALRDHLAAQPGGGLPARVLKAQQLDLGVRGDAKGFVTADDVQRAIDATPVRRHTIGSTTWSGAQRHTITKNVSDDLARQEADALASWRQLAEQHGRDSEEAKAAQQKYRQVIETKSGGPQAVMQLGAHPDTINELRRAGLLHVFHALVAQSKESGHPVMPYGGIGWVRYNEGPDGIHVDEIQSDIDKPTMKMLAANPRDAGYALGIRPDQVGHALRNIHDIVWGGHHSSDVLHEAFQQHLRDQGKGGQTIHHWQLAPKSAISGLDPEEPMPAHFQHTYDQAPRKRWGYGASQYGALTTQTNEELRGQPTWSKKLQKFGPDLDTWYQGRLTKAMGPCDPDPMELKKSAAKRLLALAAATALTSMMRPERAAIPEWRTAVAAGPQLQYTPAGGPSIPAWQQQVPATAPDAPQTIGVPLAGMQWTPKGLSQEMHPIAHLESAFGKYVAHDRAGDDYHTAYGALGFKPMTAHEQWKRSKTLQRTYPGLENPDTFMQRFRADSHMYNAVANSHWSFLKQNLGGDASKAAFGWRWGLGAAQKATPEEVDDDDYVRQYGALAAHGRPQQPKTMVVAKAELPNFYEADERGLP